jgi:hypothetical protein
MTMIVFLVVLAFVTFLLAATRFGADSRSLDSRQSMPDWPDVRHC